MAHPVDAVLEDDEGRSVLQFERVLRHSREHVWKALTEPGSLAGWHPTPFELEPEVGGAVRFLGDEVDLPQGEATEFDPPHVLAYTWGEDLLPFELRPHDDGCVPVLTHTFDDRFKAARDAAGWHLCLDALSSSLAGVAGTDATGSDAAAAGWPELNRAYEERFGIPPELATPPPGLEDAGDR